MADSTEKKFDEAADAKVDTTPTYAEETAVDNDGLGALPADRPNGWMYRERKIGSIVIPWYASPMFQLIMVSMVCFTCPGMFNALTGLGGGGRDDPTLASNMNTALYSTFAVVGFFAGSVVNRLGVKLTLAFGGIGYMVYAIALLVSLHVGENGWPFCYFAGALLGVCAGLLWTAQGTIMMSYPLESEKGRAFAWFWTIFNLGGVVGSLIPLGQTVNHRNELSVGDGTYIAFIILMFCGAVLALFLANADKVIRSDGSRVVLMKNPSWSSEFIGLGKTIISDPYILLLFPMFWSSNWFTTYQTNSVNGGYFNIRTRSLNSLLYWFSQMIGAIVFGNCLDIERFKRTTRAKASLVVLFVLTFAIWGGGYKWQLGFTREKNSSAIKGDWTDDGYVGPMFLYMFYGFYDAAWQCCVYWYMGALTNNGRKMANYVGFYKGIQSAGAAVMWSLDAHKMSFMNELISNWVLLAGSLLVAAPVIFLRIKEHVPVEEDLKFSDETIEDVLPPGHAEKIVA
ncbi:hypothetical protein O988_02399 [Pseudogymnoascus sp. VKM F-3808]|nr:hypothetical protein O988_02399 [Pseudogymnoascus sp. VKM F-3808]